MTREELFKWLKFSGEIEIKGDKKYLSSYAEGCHNGYRFAEVNQKSMICENCKHFRWDNKYISHYGSCEMGHGYYWNGRMQTVKDFGCNHFIRKQNEVK